MNEFFSEENIILHRDYIMKKRLQYSIIESSVPRLKGAGLKDIYSMKISSRDRRDSILLLSEIEIHEIYFSSFSKTAYQSSKLIADAYGSEAAFLNLIYRECKELSYGFVCIYLSDKRIIVRKFTDSRSAMHFGIPILAIDVCEHAYFLDYGFDKERYLLASLPYLDVTKLSVSG